ncbi:MAG: WXG100 family type VII secretion target [Prevotella sp.]|nr:WXG100 family type VII secretion target [Prevotella sp.]
MASDAGVKNIEQLALFGKNIKSLGENMYSTMQVAQQRMNAVCEGWQDKQNDKFKEQFNRSVQDVKKMSEQFTEYSNYIARITAKLQEYQNIR